MTGRVSAMRATIAALAMTGTALGAFAGPAHAQSDDARLRKIEAEIRALQRTVFPGGDGRFFTPENITPDASSRPTTTGTPATSAVTDILVRLDAIEAQVARLTAQAEENRNMLMGVNSRLDALEAAEAAAVVAEQTPPALIERSPSTSTQPAAQPSGPILPPPPEDIPAGPSDERLAAVQAIAKPQTDDAGDDEYSYGYRLWNAGFFPEAQQQLALFVEKYPDHWRTTYGRNLLGRAYLDDGKPREAATWFLQNYQANKQAERAPDSLLYLAESMIALEDTRRACIALAEFGDTYPALATGRLQSQYEADREKVTCN